MKLKITVARTVGRAPGVQQQNKTLQFDIETIEYLQKENGQLRVELERNFGPNFRPNPGVENGFEECGNV